MAPMRSAWTAFSLAAIAAKAAAQDAGTQPAVLAHIGLIEPLRAQAVDDMAGLVGDPFLVHVVVDARQDAHHLAPRVSTRIAEPSASITSIALGLASAPTAAP